jgi:hypothetical protein
LGHFAKDC